MVRYQQDKSLTQKHLLCSVSALALMFPLFLGSCSLREIEPKRVVPEMKFEAEHLPEENAMLFVRNDVFPLHRVTFVLNKFYFYETDLVKEREFKLSYDKFVNASGQSFNGREEEPFRIHIIAAEGKGLP